MTFKDSHFYAIAEGMDIQIGLKTIEEYPEILTTLYPEHQEVFILTLQGYGEKEIARKTKMKKKVVRWIIQFAITNGRYLIFRKREAAVKGRN